MRAAIVICVTAALLAGCSRSSIEDRAREHASKILESLGDGESRALAQPATPEQVHQAQEALTAVHEYMGEVNGKLDAVTVNAIEAFQRTRGLKDDGLLNEKTQYQLQEVLAKK